MSGGLGYLTAVYWDGRVYIGSKSYAAGIFAAHLLNRYYRNDNKEQIMDFLSLRFIEQKSNIIFVGSSGVGKTHLATAIGNR